MSLNVDRQAVKRSATASTAQHEARSTKQGRGQRPARGEVAERALLRRRVCRKRLFDGSHARQQRQQRPVGATLRCGMAGSMGREAGTVIVCTSLVQDRIDYMIDLLLKWFGSCLIHESSSHASHSQTLIPSSNLSKTSKLAKKKQPVPSTYQTSKPRSNSTSRCCANGSISI